MPLTAFIRDHGPICYEAIISDEPQLLSELPQNLLSSDLTWYWESARDRPVAESSMVYNLPAERSLTLLTVDNAAALIDDFQEQDVDDYGRSVAIFGFDAETTDLSDVSDDRFRRALNNFTANEAAPMRIAIIKIGDKRCEYVFIPHNLITPIQELLSIWGISPSAKYKTRPYRQLYTARLELMYTLPGQLDAGDWTEQRRRLAIIALGGVVLFFVGLTVLRWRSFGPPSRSEQWGLLAGAIVGGSVCRYIAMTWDPVHLRPINPQARSGRDLNAGCVLPLITGSAALMSTLIVQLLGGDVLAFARGGFSLGLVILLSYLIIQAWRHRPRE